MLEAFGFLLSNRESLFPPRAIYNAVHERYPGFIELAPCDPIAKLPIEAYPVIIDGRPVTLQLPQPYFAVVARLANRLPVNGATQLEILQILDSNAHDLLANAGVRQTSGHADENLGGIRLRVQTAIEAIRSELRRNGVAGAVLEYGTVGGGYILSTSTDITGIPRVAAREIRWEPVQTGNEHFLVQLAPEDVDTLRAMIAGRLHQIDESTRQRINTALEHGRRSSDSEATELVGRIDPQELPFGNRIFKFFAAPGGTHLP